MIYEGVLSIECYVLFNMFLLQGRGSGTDRGSGRGRDIDIDSHIGSNISTNTQPNTNTTGNTNNNYDADVNAKSKLLTTNSTLQPNQIQKQPHQPHHSHHQSHSYALIYKNPHNKILNFLSSNRKRRHVIYHGFVFSYGLCTTTIMNIYHYYGSSDKIVDSVCWVKEPWYNLIFYSAGWVFEFIYYIYDCQCFWKYCY